jgi:hypothetical protein
MITTTSCSWVITLGLMSILPAVADTSSADSQSAAALVAMESHSGGSQRPLIPAKPRGSQPDGTERSIRPSDIPDQTPAPNVRARALEERLRRGQMDRPIAQGEISDRLEQLHSGSVGRPTGETTPDQSVQGIGPD